MIIFVARGKEILLRLGELILAYHIPLYFLIADWFRVVVCEGPSHVFASETRGSFGA